MASSKQQYYRLNNLLPNRATYNLLLGERSNGKSFAVKEAVLWQAYNECDYCEYITTGNKVHTNRYMFGYLRRWRDEIKSRDVEKYFDDFSGDKILDITNGEYNSIMCYRQDIYFSKIDENGVAKRGKMIGSTFAINSATHYKSLSFPNIGIVVFEEFITDSGYLPNEVRSLDSIISTIARRDFIYVFLIGNTINRMCPYFDEWQLTHVKRQEIGTIDIYNQTTEQVDENGNNVVVKIAVEYCANSGNNSKMFFGNRTKSITSGVWETNTYQHIEKPFTDYKCIYKILYKYGTFSFVLNLLKTENNEPFIFVYPATKDTKGKIKRVITTDYTTDRLTTKYLTEITKYDSLMLNLINNDKVVFSDNLTGTEFYQIKKERGKF